MRHLVIRLFLAAAACCGLGSAWAESVTPAAQAEFKVIDSLDVEHHWPAGQHVKWESGVPDGRPETGDGKHTHCSAFAAAAAARLGVYLLRPPQHPQLLLANAQYDWLGSSEGAAAGWRPVADPVQAQHDANRGSLVLAVYHNRQSDLPGHVAIVRPSDKNDQTVREEGPQVTQAGLNNHVSVPLAVGFKGHPAAWGNHEVKFYAHTVDPR